MTKIKKIILLMIIMLEQTHLAGVILKQEQIYIVLIMITE